MTTPLRQLALTFGRHLFREPMHRVRGVTLIELICTLSIIAILSTIAVPELGYLRRAAVQRSVVNDFLHTLYLARYQAAMTNHVVSICRSRDGTTCNNRGNWQDGWIVFQNIDRDQPAEHDAGEEIVYRHTGWRTGNIASNRVSFSFRPTSQADVNGTVLFCDLHSKPSDARAIIISHTGRPRVAQRDANNRALQCP